ncbi:hypothetical protein Taro_010934 [Colocasia esculenta]|uniref:Uncharacterized protein n=1 Tax=Colocasia esculenta TaxID=4460 RepID=A0A843U8W6_COLES|nr:hypothetical protein [Colocasia esculenta]
MNLLSSTARLRGPFELLLQEHRPYTVVSDMFLPRSGEVEEQLRVPRLVFHVTSFFFLCLFVYRFADQFYNERLLVQVLGVGVSMGGAKRYTLQKEERPLVGAEEVARAVKVLMGGGGGEMRRRARELKEAARAAMREGGSSYGDMGLLIEELLGKQTTPETSRERRGISKQ